jgi:hypothetical protein
MPERANTGATPLAASKGMGAQMADRGATVPKFASEIDFDQPIVKLFHTLFEELASGLPTIVATIDRERWVAHNLYIRWTSETKCASFAVCVDRLRESLRNVSRDSKLEFVRNARFSPHIVSVLTQEYESVKRFANESAGRRDSRRALLYASLTLIDVFFGPLYAEAVKSHDVWPITLAHGHVEEGVIRSHIVNRTRPARQLPPTAAIDVAPFELGREFQYFAPGGLSPSSIKSILWFVLRRDHQISRQAKPTLALVDHLADQARHDLTLLPRDYDSQNPYFRIDGHPAARVPRIKARIDDLFAYFDTLETGMPALLCFPELSAGPETLDAIADALLRRTSQRAQTPVLTFVGHTHREGDTAGRYHNEVHVFFGSRRLDVAFRKRNPYRHKVSEVETWLEAIEGSEELLILDAPGYDRITVAICRDFLSLDLRMLSGIDVRLVIVPSMTSPTTVVTDFVHVARQLAGIGVATMFINSGWHVDAKNEGQLPIAGFFFPPIRRNLEKLAKHHFAHRDVCGGLYELTPKFQFIRDIPL